jgi:hypothetical protein
LLSGSRFVLVPTADDDVVLLPPPPPDQLVHAAAAVRDALRFPLAGPPLEAIVPRGGRVTILVDPPRLPIPGAQIDPRTEALAATIGELERCGVANERQTVLVAGGLEQRADGRELAVLFPRQLARSFRGPVGAHDAEHPLLAPVAEAAHGTVRVHRALVETDLVVVVSAAETVIDGGPGTLLDAADTQTAFARTNCDSLLEAAGAPVWELALAVEAALAARHPVVGVSLVLDLPRYGGVLHGYPFESSSRARIRRSWTRGAFGLLPAAIRRGLLSAQGPRLGVTTVFAGPPSVAHAEALLRGVALRGTPLPEPVDALVVGVPWAGPHLPREPLNPLTASASALALALRLRRNTFPIRPGGTLIVAHSLRRSFGHGETPFATMFHRLRDARAPDDLERSQQEAAADERALSAYRAGTTCHPLLPYADWAACAPALARLGRVVVAGSRDAPAARALGFIPTRGIGSALHMAHGVAGGKARIGVLVGPPYPPLLVG